jgi:RNA polymerase sigma factor (sigma-70 family)
MNSLFFSRYLNEIGKIELLSPEREAELGRLVQLGLKNQATGLERSAGEEALSALIRHNLKLVVSIANSFHAVSADLEEMTFNGNVGLARAARRFNPVKFENRFSTYATWWIQQAIRDGLERNSTIRVPTRRARLLRRIRGSLSYVDERRDQDARAIAIETGISAEKVACLLRETVSVTSLHRCGEEGDEEWEQRIDGGSEDPAFTIMRTEEKTLLRSIVNELDPVSRQIVSARFGINSDVSTLETLAEIYGVSRERVRQIEKNALRTLHRRLKRLLR